MPFVASDGYFDEMFQRSLLQSAKGKMSGSFDGEQLTTLLLCLLGYPEEGLRRFCRVFISLKKKCLV